MGKKSLSKTFFNCFKLFFIAVIPVFDAGILLGFFRKMSKSERMVNILSCLHINKNNNHK